MINYPTLIACICFILFVIINILAFLKLSKNIGKISLKLSALIGLSCTILFLYSLYIHDTTLIPSLGFGLIIILSIMIGQLINKRRKK